MSPKPHTVDVLGAVFGEIIRQCPGGGPWSIRPFDLKDVSTVRCRIVVASVFSHIVRNPESGRAEIFKMLALPFGNVKSVHSFLRVAHSIWFIMAHYLAILTTNYFDGFAVVPRESEAKHTIAVIHDLFKLLG